jgi:hypothetical protein
MDILPIQASSVPSERVFSSGKETMTARRRRISPHLMESLQILKFSINKGKSLEFTEGLSWSDEMKEFEKAARRAPLGDAEAYGRTIDTVEEDSDELEDLLDDLVKVTVGIEDEHGEGEGDDEDDIYV